MLTVFLWRLDELVHTKRLEGCRAWAALNAFTCYCCDLPPPQGSLQSLPSALETLSWKLAWQATRASPLSASRGHVHLSRRDFTSWGQGGCFLVFVFSVSGRDEAFYLVGFSSLEKEKESPQMPTRWRCESIIVMNRTCRKRRARLRLHTNRYQAHLLGAGATDPWNLCSTYISQFSYNMCFIKRSFQMLGKNSKRAGWETLLYWTTILRHLCIDVISFRGHWMNKSLQSLCRACTIIPVF